MRRNLVGQLMVTAAAVTLFSGAAHAASRGYVVSYMIPAMYNTDEKAECPNGKNVDGPGLLERIVRQHGGTEEDVKKAVDPDTFDMYKMGQLSTFRGRIDGKPTDVFLHPLSNPEP